MKGDLLAAAALVVLAVVLGPNRASAQPASHAGAASAPESMVKEPTGDSLAGLVTREALVRIAIQRSPALAASRARARAMRAEGEAEAKLPPPMAEAQIWQLPIKEPHRVDRAGMTMIGVRQEFPPGKMRRARAHAARLEAHAEGTMEGEQARMLAREVEHAFTDYVEAHELVRVHEAHKVAADRVAAYARARYAAGGSLSDVAQAESEIAMIEVDLAMARRKIDVARARINGLLLRPIDAHLGPPSVPKSAPRASADRLLRQAEAARPELKLAHHKREVARAMADADASEARTPMLGAGLYYFPPSESMPIHGIGASISSTLPWLWGAPKARSRAAEARYEAALREEQAARAQVRLEVAEAAAEIEEAISRIEALEKHALPASRRAEEATLAGYEASLAEILSYLMARTKVVATEVAIVEARAALEHNLTEMRWVAGGNYDPAPIRRPGNAGANPHGR